MYLKKITIQNYGPLKNFVLEMPFNKDSEGKETTPKPLIIVGINGSGKTIILSHIVNNFLITKQTVYDDIEVQKDYVYKIRSPYYINDSYFYYARLDFSEHNYTIEYQLHNSKNAYEEMADFVKPNDDWDKIPTNKTNCLDSTFVNKRDYAKKIIDNNVIKYFPSDRTSTPAWLNAKALIAPQTYSHYENFSSISNRSIIYQDEFELNKCWIMDLILDRELYDRKIVQLPPREMKLPGQSIIRELRTEVHYIGATEVLYNEISKIINTIFRQNDLVLRIGTGPRKDRRLGILRIKDDYQILPNLSQLSLGESVLLNMFLSIIRDADNTKANWKSFDDIEGIVLIDEIENHLHNDLISKALPELIKMFPKIQFIITSHSPIFLLGMENTFNDKFQIIELDSCEQNGYSIKNAEQFSEFHEAFAMYQNTQKFKEQICRSNKPVVLTEGETDVQLISKAWQILHPTKEMPFDIIGLSPDGGSGAKAINSILSKLRAIPGKKIIGLFDADFAGIQQFSGLTDKQKFQFCENRDIKIKEHAIFATCLPVPEEKYFMKGIENGFEIEDYFNDAAIEGYSQRIAKITRDEDGNQTIDDNDKYYQKFHEKKERFAEHVQGYTNEDGRFNHFQQLFDRLEEIIRL